MKTGFLPSKSPKRKVSVLFMFSLFLYFTPLLWKGVGGEVFAQNIAINTDGTVGETGLMLDIKGTNTLATTATQNIFQIKSFDVSTAALKLRLGLGTNVTATSLYGSIDVYDAVNSAYRALALQPAGGNVGIGITNPGTTLDIVSPSATAAGLRITKSSSTVFTGNYDPMLTLASTAASNDAVGINYDALGTYAFAGIRKGGYNWEIVTDLTGAVGGPLEAFAVTRLGNVGIGTTGPGKKLSVESTTSDAIWLKGNTSGGSPYIGAYIIAESNADYRGRGLFLPTTAAEANASWFAGVPYNSVNSFQIGCSSTHATENASGPYITSNAKLYINSAGNVGIGTIVPNSALDIAAGAMSFNSSSGGYNTIQGNQSSTWLFQSRFDNIVIQSGVDNSNPRTITLRTGLTSTNGIFIDNIGSVGVGTTSPTSKLQVVGLPVYANNAAALAGGLTVGAFYRTGADPDPVCVVH